MTAQILFNQLAYIDRLTRGGFSPEQARASAEALETAFTESVATKSDLAEVRTALKQDIAEVRTEIAEVRTELKQEIAEVRTEIAQVRTEIAQSKNDILRWVFAFNLVLIGAIFGIIKFVH
jgi:septal ring factor EnvC (AmiA/AmiB activator)